MIALTLLKAFTEGAFLKSEIQNSAEVVANLNCLPIHLGELRIMRSKECLDIDGNGLGNVHTWECVGDKDQIILFCEDGTMRNDLMNTCI